MTLCNVYFVCSSPSLLLTKPSFFAHRFLEKHSNNKNMFAWDPAIKGGLLSSPTFNCSWHARISDIQHAVIHQTRNPPDFMLFYEYLQRKHVESRKENNMFLTKQRNYLWGGNAIIYQPELSEHYSIEQLDHHLISLGAKNNWPFAQRASAVVNRDELGFPWFKLLKIVWTSL